LFIEGIEYRNVYIADLQNQVCGLCDEEVEHFAILGGVEGSDK